MPLEILDRVGPPDCSRERKAHRGSAVVRPGEASTPSPSGHFLGGADRDRTDDLRLAKPALSQLSYSPGLQV